MKLDSNLQKKLWQVHLHNYMQDFIQWLNERGKRTALGIYPPQYGTGQYPPLYFMPISATAAFSFEKIHGDEHPELLKKKKKSKKKDKKKD